MTITLPTDGFGVYEGINTLANSAVYQPRLQQIAAGGFKLVMNYNILHGHIADVIAYINYAASQSLKVIVYLADPAIWKTATYSTAYAQLYADAGNPGTGIAFMQYIVAQTKNLAGVWGWYVGDEVLAADHTTFKTYTDAVKAADSTHPRLVIQGAGDATNSFGASTTAMWDCCDVGGDDYYPIGVQTGNTLTVAGISADAPGVQAYCTTKGISSAFALQAHSLANYNVIGAPWPTVSQMITMRNNALSNMNIINASPPRVILWYSYFDVVSATAPSLQFYYLENASQGRTGIALFPTAKRRGSPDQNDYYHNAITGESNLLAYYRHGEASGTVANDSSGNGRSGTISSTGITYSQPGAINYDSNTSLLFNGGWIILPSSVNGSGLSAFSIECWFNLSTLTLPVDGFANVFVGATPNTNNSCQFYLLKSGALIEATFQVGNGTIHATAADIPLTPYTINTWYYAVGTYDGSTVSIYVNGVLRGQASLAGAIGTAVSTPVLGASQGHNDGFPGWIDEVAIYNKVLSTQIPTHYAAALRAPSTAALFPSTTRRQS